MKKIDASDSSSDLITKKIAELGDWRGATLAQLAGRGLRYSSGV